MDEAVLKMYRRLLQTGFEYAGSLEDPSVFLDSQGENIAICDVAGRDYMKIYMHIKDGTVENIRYLCSCDPAANVVVEVMCKLAGGKTLDEVKNLTAEPFFEEIGSRGEIVDKKARGIIELVKRGIERYQAGVYEVLTTRYDER